MISYTGLPLVSYKYLHIRHSEHLLFTVPTRVYDYCTLYAPHLTAKNTVLPIVPFILIDFCDTQYEAHRITLLTLGRTYILLFYKFLLPCVILFYIFQIYIMSQEKDANC